MFQEYVELTVVTLYVLHTHQSVSDMGSYISWFWHSSLFKLLLITQGKPFARVVTTSRCGRKVEMLQCCSGVWAFLGYCTALFGS